MNRSNRAIKLTRSNNKSDSIEFTKNLKDFKDSVINKYCLVTADIFYLDENNFRNLIETQKQFFKLVESENPHFYLDESIDKNQGGPNDKFDTENLNDKFREVKNATKSRNTLEIIKREKALIKKKLRQIKKEETPSEDQQLLQAALNEYRNFENRRVTRKFWKDSEKFHCKGQQVYA